MKTQKPLLKAAALFLLLIAAYLLIGGVAYLMPDGKVRQHVEWSLDKGDLGEDYPKAIIPLDGYKLDNFTDALIINEALNLRKEGPKGILLNPRHTFWDLTSCDNLRGAVYGSEKGEHIVHYARYWHGSSFLTRIALVFSAMPTIRFILYIITSLAMLWCFTALWRRVGKGAALAVAAGLMAVNVFVMQFSLQFAPVLLIALAGMLWTAYNGRKARWNAMMCFLVLGSLTAYLDLLTVPTITLGLPLLTLIAARRDTELKSAFATIVGAGATWSLSYALTWGSKWVVATLLTGENIFKNANDEARHWTDNGSTYISDALTSNLAHVHWGFILVPAAAMIILALICHRKGGWKLALQCVAVGLIPFAYLMVMPHHSFHHEWFTYRTLATATVAILAAALSMVDWSRCLAKAKELRSERKAS